MFALRETLHTIPAYVRYVGHSSPPAARIMQ